MGVILDIQRFFVFLYFSIIVSSVYVYHDTPMTYRDGRLACEAGKGQLVVLDSQEKTDDFTIFMAGMKTPYPILNEIWFALSYDTAWEKFIWPDDSDATWTKWDATQPAGHTLSPYPQLCGRIRRNQGYKLTTTYCNNVYTFACESDTSVYTYFDSSMNYHDAIIHCRDRGDKLLMMDSLAKVNDFKDYVDNLTPELASDVAMWISLTFDLSWDSFLWLDYVPTQLTTFDYWADQEPDNNPPKPGEVPFLCGRASDASNYAWTMVDCKQPVPYVCEYDVLMTTAEQSTATEFDGLFKIYETDKKPVATAFDSLSAGSVQECTLACVRFASCAFIHFQANVCSLHGGSSVGSLENDPLAEIWERF